MGMSLGIGLPGPFWVTTGIGGAGTLLGSICLGLLPVSLPFAALDAVGLYCPDDCTPVEVTVVCDPVCRGMRTEERDGVLVVEIEHCVDHEPTWRAADGGLTDCRWVEQQ
jgi:hypothetical protein